MTLVAFVLLATIPHQPIQSANVDLVERNTYCDEEGSEVFTQYIFSDWNTRHGRHEIVDFRMDDGQIRREGNVLWFAHLGEIHRVRTEHLRESKTQYDPELQERECRPMGRRRKLWGGKP